MPEMFMNRRRGEKGFTLVELAISLTIIGLLMVAFLRGQEILVNARANSLMRQLRSYDSGVALFQDSYGFLPGDIRVPRNTVPNCSGGLCVMGGNGDNVVRNLPLSGTVTQPEEYNFFPHLSRAEVISDEILGAANLTQANNDPSLFKPRTIYKQLITMAPDGEGRALYIIPNMPPKVMLQVDQKLDNGKPDHNLTGSDVPRRVFVKGAACPVSGNEYDLTVDVTNSTTCLLHVYADF